MTARMNKVNQELKRIISHIITSELNEVDLLQYFYTVSRVECSPDLREARAFISVLGEEETSTKGFKQLCQHLKKIQKLFREKVHLKYTPKVLLVLDVNQAHADRIHRILLDLKTDESQ